MSEKADIRELAIAAWRLEKWLDNLKAERKVAAKSALRSIKKYIDDSGVEIKDPLGSRFDPGLAVEVLNNEAEDTPEENLIIIETVSPYVYLNGELVQHARVIIGAEVKEAHENNEILKKEPQLEVSSEKQDEAVTQPNKVSQDDIERMMAYAKIL